MYPTAFFLHYHQRRVDDVAVSFDSLCVKRLDIESDECRQGVKQK